MFGKYSENNSIYINPDRKTKKIKWSVTFWATLHLYGFLDISKLTVYFTSSNSTSSAPPFDWLGC